MISRYLYKFRSSYIHVHPSHRVVKLQLQANTERTCCFSHCPLSSTVTKSIFLPSGLSLGHAVRHTYSKYEGHLPKLLYHIYTVETVVGVSHL